VLSLRFTGGLPAGAVVLVVSLVVALAVADEERAVAVDAPPVLIAAGDIASCTQSGDEATAAILDQHLDATVATLGDNVYENATAADFANCYEPTWGRHKARTHPSAGNHEYNTAGATGYFNYFGAAAGDPSKGYYSYDLGAWHVLVVNSNCSKVGGCGAGSAQEQWVRADLAAHPSRCTLAYWHHPRFTSGPTGSDAQMQPIWQALYDFEADLVLSGHSHVYERFAPQTPTGTADPVRGIREFVVGTGGAGLHNIGGPAPNSEVRRDDTYGVLRLTLEPTAYSWEFLPQAGKTFTDSGSDACHPAGPPDTTPPAAPAALSAAAPSSSRVDLSWTAATDDVGVTRYEILRDGLLIGSTGSATTFADTTVVPLTTYGYVVYARDAAGNISQPSNAASATTPPGPVTLTFAATADARVQEANPATNYGSSNLRTDGGSDPDVESYLRFSVSGVTGTVQRAALRLSSTNGTVDGPAVYPTGTAWSEGGLTWSNRPARAGPATDDRGAISTGTWAEWDVTPLVSGNGDVALVLAQVGSDGIDFNARDATSGRPELIVTVFVGPPDLTAPTAPSELSATAPSSSRVDLTWTAGGDDVGVASHDVLRDGAVIASTGSGTSYSDTSVAPSTTYTYAVRARDAAGNMSPLSNATEVVTPTGPVILTFGPVADARVQESSPTTNYGGLNLRTDGGSDPDVESYLRFAVSGLSGPVQRATLTLHATNGTVDGPAVYPTGTGWSEGGLTWNSRPVRTGPPSDDKGAISTGTTSQWDVTPLVSGNGDVAFVLAQVGNDGGDFNSREAASQRPELVVESTPGAPDTLPPTAPTGLSAVAASASRVDLTWAAATDDVGVSGYEILRDGAVLARTGAVTTYSDTTVAPSTAYVYQVRALDAAGNPSPPSETANATTPAGPVTLVFAAVADARVLEGKPDTNYGGSSLRTDAGGGPDVESYLRFAVSGVTGPVQRATLRLRSTSGTVDGPAVYPTSIGWSESALTWTNRPARTGAASDDRGAIATGTWAEWDVTPLVTGNGDIGFVLAQLGSDGVDFGSREAASMRPELIVTT